MRVTLLGHSSVLVEASGRAIVIDPVFGDDFAEGMLLPCPARRVSPQRLPRLDAIILTQGAPDHFDLESLAKLPRDRVVLCVRDEAVVYGLERLGFTQVRPVDINSLAKIGSCEILTTPSARPELEFGVTIKDSSGVFWHLADTVVTTPMVQHVRGLVGRVDLLFAPYAPQHFAYYGTQRFGYPVNEIHERIARIREIAPNVVVPASAGFRFSDPFAWVNSFVFPVSRERFLSDMARLAPSIRSVAPNPGDAFDIVNGKVTHRPSDSRVAATIADDTHRIEFDPSVEVPAISDPNFDRYESGVLAKHVDDALSNVARFVRDNYDGDPVIAALRQYAASYAVGITFPNGDERWLRIELESKQPAIQLSVARPRPALTTHRTVASLVAARARGERSYTYTAGLARLSLISPAELRDGAVVIEPREPRDPLVHVLGLPWADGRPMWQRHLDHRLARLRAR